VEKAVRERNMRSTDIIVAAVIAASTAGMRPPTAGAETLIAELSGLEEVPPVSSRGSGSFLVLIGQDVLEFELSYSDLEGSVQEAHIHFGQPRVNGGISVFLCSNLGKPADVQECPEAPATVTGVIGPGDVIGPSEQGIDAGDIDELVEALSDGVTYINVHTDVFPAGEIRGQLGEAPEERLVDDLLEGLAPPEGPQPGFF
jgi:hypothetical protein